MKELFDLPPAEPRPKQTCTPARLGTGPAGETCGSCRFAINVQHHDSFYWKCDVMRALWTHGAGSDIRLKWEACSSWQPSSEA